MNNPHKNKNYSEEEKKKCPFYNKHIQQSPYNEKIHISSCKKNQQSKLENQIKKNDLEKIAEKENQQQNYSGSGCPIMQTKEENRNPGLFIPKIQMPIPYISPFNEFLKQNISKTKDNKNYEKWNNYPIYLKESLFYYSENFQKLRQVEVGYKFFASDEMKEKANYYYNKGQYQQAINCLSKAISLFQWLETDLPQNQNLSDSIKEDKDLNSMINLQHFGSFFKDKLNQLMFQHFTDDNTHLHEYVTSKQQQDIDMEKNTLFNLYANLAVCFQKANHHYEAKQTIKSMEQLGIKNSVFYFKKAQIISANQLSTIEELKEIKGQIQKAIEIKKKEEVYKHNIKFLKMFGLENHEEIFQKLYEFIELQIIEKEVEQNKDIENIIIKLKRYLDIEQQIINRGLIPEDSNFDINNILGIKNFELKLIKKMKNIYQSAFEFYNKDDQQKEYESIKIGYSNFLKVQQKFNKWWFQDIKNIQNNILFIQLLKQNNIDINKKKQDRIILKIIKKNAKEIIEQSSLDLSIYQYAVEQIMKSHKNKKDENNTQKNKQKTKYTLNELKNFLQLQTTPKNQILLLFIGIALFTLLFNVYYKILKYQLIQ